MINTKNLNEARKQIQKLKKENKQAIIQAQDDNFNRKMFENPDIDMIIGLELDKKDRLKQRDSGLNEVHCRLAAKNKIKIGIDLKKISKLDKAEKARVLARVMQNIRLCKKSGARIVALNGNKQDIRGLFLSLKASTSQAKQAVF